MYTAQIAFNISYSLCNALYPCFEVNNSIDVLSMTMREALEFSMYTANTPQKILLILLQILLINLFFSSVPTCVLGLQNTISDCIVFFIKVQWSPKSVSLWTVSRGLH